MENDLLQFGAKVASSKYLKLCAEAENNKPWLEQYDAYGKRIDIIHTSEGWKYFKAQAALEKLVSIAYKNSDKSSPDYNPNSRLHQIVKLMLFSASSALVSCPLSMTDGAAFTIRQLKRSQSKYYSEELAQAYESLTSTDPRKMWTSGQWMTEKRGGSDVSAGTDTVAIENKETNQCQLYGYKWFTSAVDSEMTLALARFPDSEQEIETNQGKLGLVFLKIRDKKGDLNKIQVVRLKDKLGTRQLPTAELILKGTIGTRISDIGKGVNMISNMLNITRIHNALCSLGYMRRMSALANDYKDRRVAFGQKLVEHQLHLNVIAKFEKTYRGNLLILLETVLLLQQQDHENYANKDKLRLLTSILKLFTAKDSIAVASEGIESFGGLGYMENTRIPQILRDAQVLSIWEGTTNILSLDFLKDLMKQYSTKRQILLDLLHYDTNTKLDSIKTKEQVNSLLQYRERFIQSLDKLFTSKDVAYIKSQARTIAFKQTLQFLIYYSFAFLFVPFVFLKRVMPVHSKDAAEIEVFNFWIQRLLKEYQDPIDEISQNHLYQRDLKLLKGPSYGKDVNDIFQPRQKL
ncbi:protein acdh-isoform a [Stylonychia lemnae]|uniref:Protein acdh-isoform a n=1 Tax=Stylonychia lemnae TaxID=5949 RepID=A0A077ZYT0_STYLE|nr:protein acdh-isoform a [Stylonychia lemnae]|eukprot:CDW73693.1 protein acdh-isoform a [Stylonychia lemnae]